MIAPMMYFGIGFLVAALIGLVIIPLVHGRAVRLTMRRLEAATPLSMAEIQADKDQLRADFAMSTRRLEMSVEQLKAQSTSQLAELGKKSDAINRLKIELSEKTATIFMLEARDTALRDQLRAAEEDIALKAAAMHDAERTLAGKEAELAKAATALGEHSSFADRQKTEIGALKAEIEGLNERLTAAGHKVKAAEDSHEAERVERRATVKALSDERGKVENLGRRVAELEQHLAAQTAEAEIVGRRAHELEDRLTAQSRLLAQSEVELQHLRTELDAARKAEGDLRNAMIELDRAKDERDRLSRDLAAMKRETEEAWASERTDNALLRERINDVAAEVARLASALEGPNSPIDSILAAETARDRAAVTTTAPDVPIGEGGNLADRIRALQRHASRLPPNDEPQTRN
jgi:chromosome segregation ATPase